jgi:hypothetical protein
MARNLILAAVGGTHAHAALLVHGVEAAVGVNVVVLGVPDVEGVPAGHRVAHAVVVGEHGGGLQGLHTRGTGGSGSTKLSTLSPRLTASHTYVRPTTPFASSQDTTRGVQKDTQGAVHYVSAHRMGHRRMSHLRVSHPQRARSTIKTHALRAPSIDRCSARCRAGLTVSSVLHARRRLPVTRRRLLPQAAFTSTFTPISPPQASVPTIHGRRRLPRTCSVGCPRRGAQGAQAPLDANLWRHQHCHVAATQLLRPQRPSRPAGSLVSRDLSSLPLLLAPVKGTRAQATATSAARGKEAFCERATAAAHPSSAAAPLRHAGDTPR